MCGYAISSEMNPEEAQKWAENLFHFFAVKRTENRDIEPEKIKCFCMLDKHQFIQWAKEFHLNNKGQEGKRTE